MCVVHLLSFGMHRSSFLTRGLFSFGDPLLSIHDHMRHFRSSLMVRIGSEYVYQFIHSFFLYIFIDYNTLIKRRPMKLLKLKCCIQFSPYMNINNFCSFILKRLIEFTQSLVLKILKNIMVKYY